MPMIQVPNSFRKFLLEYEHWRHEWKAWALLEGTGETAGACWYLGVGANPDLASKELYKKIERGEKHSVLEKPSASIASSSRGFRNLEKSREEKAKSQPPLEELF